MLFKFLSERSFLPHPDNYSDVMRVVQPLSMWRGEAESPKIGEIVGVRLKMRKNFKASFNQRPQRYLFRIKF